MTAAHMVDSVRLSAEDVSLVPFQPAWVPMAWEWMNESPGASFDDYGQSTLGEFSEQLLQRHQMGHIIIGVLSGGVPVGIIGFQPVTPRLGEFAGICFAKHVHGKGIATAALSLMLQSLWVEGYEKIEAMFFADNERIAKLFRRLGAHDEGLLFEHTVRGGQPIDCKLMGFVRSRGM